MRSNSNPIARILAPVALLVTVIVLISVVGSSLGGDDGGSGNRASGNGNQNKSQNKNDSKPSGVQKSAIKRGFYVVEDGDTLVDISAATGVSVEDLQDLNEDLDPQRLVSGQKVFLRPR